MKIKKLLPSIPVCPHCGTVYGYNEVRKSINKKTVCCYHCEKNFRVSRKKFILLIFLVIAAAVLINLAELNIIKNINIIGVAVTNIIVVSLGLVFLPYFTGYVKPKTNNEKA